MAESPRVPCCVVGCRRTFRTEDLGHSTEIMCGKHYRCDRELLVKFKRTRLRMRKVNRIGRALIRFHGMVLPASVERRLNRVWNKLQALEGATWGRMREKAQELQDSGYWAVRPRLEPKPKDKLADPFEREFQRMKTAQKKFGQKPGI